MIPWHRMPAIVRRAFRTAHEPSDVWAALRAYHAAAAYLGGSNFPGQPHSCVDDPATFCAIRADAQRDEPCRVRGESEAAT